MNLLPSQSRILSVNGLKSAVISCRVSAPPPKRAIPFRTVDPFVKITANLIAANGSTGEKIEFMCDGQQIVAAGIHPDTGKPYAWPLGNPTDIAHEDLPDISTAEAQQLVADIVELL
jgi:hypothetical protein